MGFSLSGRVGAGAQDAAAMQIADLLAKQKFAEELRAQQAREAMAQQQLALSTRRQDFAESQANDEMQQGAINDMRAQQEKQKLNLTRLQGEADFEQGMNDSTLDPIKRISLLRRGGVTGLRPDDLMSPQDRAAAEEAALNAELKKHEEMKKIDARYRPPDTSTQTKHPHVINGKLMYLTPEEVNAMGGVDPTPRQRPVTGAERNNLGFYQRAQQAEEIVTPLETNIAKLGAVDQMRLGYQGPGANWVQSGEGQRYRQAQRAFTEARLRKESGAAIPQNEYDNDAQTYFAQPGDTPDTIKQKQQARQQVLESLATATGSAWEEYYGSPRETAGAKSSGTIRYERGPDGKLRRVQ